MKRNHISILLNYSLLLLIPILFSGFSGSAQTVINEINTESYDNYANSYNYTYWDQNWLTSSSSRSFSNQTEEYGLNINYSNLTINNLIIIDTSNITTKGFNALNSAIFPNSFSGNIDYAILQNGAIAHAKASSPTFTGAKDSQMSEFGTWCNRRFVSTNFTNSAPTDRYFTGVEFTNWHNRFKITFHVKPTADINNGQLKLSVEIPSQYSNYYNNTNLHAFAQDTNKGFVVKGGENADSINITGNIITVLTNSQTLLSNGSYEVSIVFHTVKQNIATNFSSAFDKESQLTITANQATPSALNLSSSVVYSENEGMHSIEIPRYGMGQYNCGLIDREQSINFSIVNSSTEQKTTRLCIKQTPSTNVTGFNSLICNANGDPSGLPIQVSKNWHTTTSQLYSGSWIKEYVEFIIPANTTLNFQYRRTGAKWGETYTASSHQLSVVGAGIPRGGWLEAALGSFGESITHSPDYVYGRTNGADIRPFLVTNQNYGGTSTQCGWTGNLGGTDICVYTDSNNVRRYQSQVKTKFHRYSPNLSETTVGFVSADNKLKLEYTFYLNRSDDYMRVYYKIKVEALENTSFSRFDIFQMGGDIYNIYNAQQVVYGNDTGVVNQFSPTNTGTNNYTTPEIALTGDNPWVWAGDGLYYTGANSGIDIDGNNGFIIRDYEATINGTINNTPYLRERSSSQGFSASRGNNPTSYCIVTPPGTNSFSTGDKIELLVEMAVLPKTMGDYYGPNTNFNNALTLYGNSSDLFYREVVGNKIIAESPTNTINTTYPLTVETAGNTGLVKITGGRGYIPVVFSGLTNITDPKLWKAQDSCWELVDQSVHGKDFWQTNFDVESRTFDIVYNVNQDILNDETAVIQYYLGPMPPALTILTQSKIGEDSLTNQANVSVISGLDSVIFSPKIIEYGITDTAIDSNYNWTGPNNFTHTGRKLYFNPVNLVDSGVYTLVYTNEFGCSDTITYSITIDGFMSLNSYSAPNIELYPNPFTSELTIKGENLLDEEIKLYSLLGTDVTSSIEIISRSNNEIKIRIKDLNSSLYFLQVGSITKKVYKK